jgi:hypothetical protein
LRYYGVNATGLFRRDVWRFFAWHLWRMAIRCVSERDFLEGPPFDEEEMAD